MRELQLDGIHEDGEHAVLIDSDGEQYALRIDDALRAAVRRDRPALGIIQASASGPLRPRDIQAQLRAGREAQEIADAAGIDVDHIRRYEGPVLAERRWIAERAGTFHMGRGGGPSLAELTEQRLRARRAASETSWDAWRLDDGTWTVELVFRAGGRDRAAHWNVDMIRQSVTPDDDEARWLTDDDISPKEESSTAGRARLTAVRRGVYDVEADGGVDHPSIGPGRSRRGEAIDEAEITALNARRGLRPVAPLPEPDEASVWTSLDDADAFGEPDDGSGTVEGNDSAADADAAEEHATDGGPELLPSSDDVDGETEDFAADDRIEIVEDDADDAHEPGDDDPVHGTSERTQATEEINADDLTPLPGFEGDGDGATPAQQPRSKKKPKRASMPSWDEIVFGKKND